MVRRNIVSQFRQIGKRMGDENQGRDDNMAEYIQQHVKSQTAEHRE